MAYKLKPKELKQKWVEYSEKCDAGYIDIVRYKGALIEVPKRIIYCVEDFCCFAGTTDEELKTLGLNKNYKAIVKEIRFAVLARKLKALVNGEGNASGLIFDLKANYGLYPKKAGDKDDEDIEYKVTFKL